MQFIIKMQNKLEKERKCSSSMRNADFCTFFFLSNETKKNLAQIHTKCMDFCPALFNYSDDEGIP